MRGEREARRGEYGRRGIEWRGDAERGEQRGDESKRKEREEGERREETGKGSKIASSDALL